MKIGRVNFDMLNASWAMAKGPGSPVKPAKNPTPVIEGDEMVVPLHRFPVDFVALVARANKKGLSTIRIDGLDAKFMLGGEREEATPRVKVEFLRERGVAASLGNNERVAVLGYRDKVIGYLCGNPGDLPVGLVTHATHKPAEGERHLVRAVDHARTALLERGQLSPYSIRNAYLLYGELSKLENSGESLIVSIIIQDQAVPALRIWRPDAPITAGPQKAMHRLLKDTYHGDPVLGRVHYGPAKNIPFDVIVTAIDYALDDKEQVPKIVHGPCVHPHLGSSFSWGSLRRSEDVHNLAGRIKEPGRRMILLDQDSNPLADFYGPGADIPAKTSMTIRTIQSLGRYKALRDCFAEAGGVIAIVPDAQEKDMFPKKIATITLPDFKLFLDCSLTPQEAVAGYLKARSPL